jgi:hypothetical protein
MVDSSSRSSFLTARYSVLIALSLVCATSACSRQKEGERCSLENGDLDCDSALVCTDSSKLRKGADEVDRCCPEELGSTSNQQCALATNSPNGSGGQGGGGANGNGGDGASTGETELEGLGDACDYTSECVEPLVCGPGGECQYECNVNRDCDSGEICNAERSCVPG